MNKFYIETEFGTIKITGENIVLEVVEKLKHPPLDDFEVDNHEIN